MRVLGRHVVSDPRIRHGKPTFRGTRVCVEDVLEQVASGMAWEAIAEEWNRSVTVEAIREAVERRGTLRRFGHHAEVRTLRARE